MAPRWLAVSTPPDNPLITNTNINNNAQSLGGQIACPPLGHASSAGVGGRVPYHRYTRLGQPLRIAANARDQWRIVNFFQARRRRSVVHREHGYAGWRRACDLFPR